MSDPSRRVGPGTLADTDVWELDLTQPADLGSLSVAERERAARFRFDRDRARFERRRAGLRRILAGYTGTAPSELAFVTNGYGKPALAAGPPFSASSSGTRALVAVSHNRQVGIDVEQVNSRGGERDLARRLFADEEVAAITGVGDFFRCWSRKEAYVKAVGKGLSFPLGSFAVEVHDTARPRLLRSDLRPDDLVGAALFDLSDSSADEFAACLVVLEEVPLFS